MKPPKHLQADGKTFWSGMVDEYGITDAAGLALVTTAAECLDRQRQAQKLIKKHGPCVETGNGGLKSNPACKLEVDSRNGFLAAMRALNLDMEPLRDGPGRPAGTFGRNKA